MQFFIRIMLVCLCTPGWVWAHTGSITGTVTDSLSGQPLPYTNVSIINTGFGSVVDEQGKFFLENIPEGIYHIQFSHIGFGTVIRKIEIISTRRLHLDIKLRRIILDFSEIPVTSHLAPDEAFTSIKTIDIQLRPVNSSQDVLRIIPGLFIAQHGGVTNDRSLGGAQLSCEALDHRST